MFEQELIRLMEEYRRYEEMTSPFKYCQDTEGSPYIAMKKKQYNSELMKDRSLGVCAFCIKLVSFATKAL